SRTAFPKQSLDISHVERHHDHSNSPPNRQAETVSVFSLKRRVLYCASAAALANLSLSQSLSQHRIDDLRGNAKHIHNSTLAYLSSHGVHSKLIFVLTATLCIFGF